MPEFYPANIQPTPVAVWSTERLVDGYGGVFGSIQKIGGASIALPFVADKLDQAALETFLAGEPYGKVTYVNNQWPSNSNDLRIMGGVEPPHIIPAYKIGTCAAMLFEGATTNGTQYGLEIINSLAAMNIKDGNWTVIAVLRPTQSHFLPQSTLGHAEEGGTILSLEGSPILHAVGGVAGGSNILTNVTPTDGIVPGMLITSTSMFPLADSHVDHVEPTGPNTGNVIFFGGGPIETRPDAQLVFSNPIVRCYQSGGPNPGGWAISNKQYFGGEIKYEPENSCAVEVRPVVVAWTNRNNAAASANDVPGFKTWQNEVVQSATLFGIRPDLVTTGFVGRNGGSVGVKWTQAGDFWLAALMIWNVALTQAQRAIVAESLRARFNINAARSTPAVPHVTTMGDSITQEYVTKGNYGWLKRLADKFPDNVRFLNQSAAGSVVTNLYPNYPTSGSNEGQWPLWVKRNVAYSATKNVFIMWGGGNDLIASQEYFCKLNAATDEVTTSRRAQAGASTTAGNSVLTLTPPVDLKVGAIVENDTTPGSIPAGTAVQSFTATTVTLNALVTAPGVAAGDFIRFRYHNMTIGKRLEFKVLPALIMNLTIGTIYWVQAVTAVDKFKISATRGGAVVDIGGSQAPDEFGTTWLYTRTAAEVFGTPTTGGLQWLIAEATKAGATKCYMLTNTPRVGLPYVTVLDDLNTLIKAGGAGGYEVIDVASNPIFATQNVPPGHIGPGNADSAHLNEAGSQAVADQIYPILNAYLNP